MRFLVAVVLALVLAGCANPRMGAVQEWSDQQKALAEKGEVKFSAYYIELFDKLSAIGDFNGRAETLARLNRLIQAAELYEAGRIDKQGFDGIRRSIQVEQERESADRSAAGRAAMGRALSDFGQKVYGPEATRARQIPTQPVQTYQPPQTIRCQTFGTQTVCN